MDWKPTFMNFLKHIPGRRDVPLSYIIRSPGYTAVDGDMLDKYIENAPHSGEAFTTDCSEVHTYIAKFIKGNSTAESVVISHGQANNGRANMDGIIDSKYFLLSFSKVFYTSLLNFKYNLFKLLS